MRFSRTAMSDTFCKGRIRPSPNAKYAFPTTPLYGKTVVFVKSEEIWYASVSLLVGVCIYISSEQLLHTHEPISYLLSPNSSPLP